MSIKITKEEMIEIQKVLRQIMIIRNKIGNIEGLLSCIKNETNKIYQSLDNIADGD